MQQPIRTLAAAYHFAAEHHVDQRRKGKRAEPYMNHLAEVAELVSACGASAEVIAAAVLHDVVEDQAVAIEEVEDRFGKDIARYVAEVTDNKQLDKAERKRLQIATAASKSVGARMIKIADKTSNLRALAKSPPTDWPAGRVREYLHWARQVVDQCRGTNPSLESEFDGAASTLERAIDASSNVA